MDTKAFSLKEARVWAAPIGTEAPGRLGSLEGWKLIHTGPFFAFYRFNRLNEHYVMTVENSKVFLNIEVLEPSALVVEDMTRNVHAYFWSVFGERAYAKREHHGKEYGFVRIGNVS